MNICSNNKCSKELYKHNLFCYKCGFKAKNPIVNNLRPLLKRSTHIFCHSCIECIETYEDEYCRNCGIKQLSYEEISDDIFKNNYYLKKNNIENNLKKKLK